MTVSDIGNDMTTISKSAYEGDLVQRLRNWRGLHLAHGGELFEQAANEIDSLREAIRRLAEQDATLSVSGGAVTVTLDATLTAEEREAIHYACGDVSDITGPVEDTLRGLLERTAKHN